METSTGAGHTPIYKHWWFWVGVVLLVAATAYAKRYTDWNAQYMAAHTEDYARAAATQVLQYQEEQTKKAYQSDTYGGDTPEETLKLFIDALEKKDFALAAKYYVPEKQNSELAKIKGGDSVAMATFISAYKTATFKTGQSKTLNEYGIDVFAKGDKIPYSFRFMKNPFTNKWKITEPS